MSPAGDVLITGAGRLPGARLLRRLHRRRLPGARPGAQSREAGRLAPIAQGGIFRGELPDTIDEPPSRACARWFTAPTRPAPPSPAQARRTNVAGTENLVRLARARGAGQLVFVSSMAAHEAAASVYGKTKFELEKRFDGRATPSSSPPPSWARAAFSSAPARCCAACPVLPLFYADRRLQTIWMDDACQGTGADRGPRRLRAALLLAHPEATPMREFYAAIAARGRRPAEDLPFPRRSGAGRHPPAGSARPEAADHVGQSAGHQAPARTSTPPPTCAAWSAAAQLRRIARAPQGASFRPKRSIGSGARIHFGLVSNSRSG